MWLIFRILYGNPKKELLRSLWEELTLTLKWSLGFRVVLVLFLVTLVSCKGSEPQNESSNELYF